MMSIQGKVMLQAAPDLCSSHSKMDRMQHLGWRKCITIENISSCHAKQAALQTFSERLRELLRAAVELPLLCIALECQLPKLGAAVSVLWQCRNMLQYVHEGTKDLSQEVKVIELVIVLHDLALDLARVHPCYKVLHVPCDKKCWVCDGLGADPHMALLHKSHGFPHGLRHPDSHQDDS